MSLFARRFCAWATGVLLVGSTGLAGCTEDGQPRTGSASATARASGTASGSVAGSADARGADLAAQAVSKQMAAYDGIFTGVLALIRVGAETRFVTRGYGDLAVRAAMTPRGRFQVASVTKAMVATLVMELVESGRLRLSDTVDRFLPGMVPAGGRITIEHLLSHRSGLPDYYVNTREHYEPGQLVRIALAGGQRSPIGTGLYANTNYILLGLIVEKLTGQPLGDLLRRRVFDVAGMSRTSFTPNRGGQPEIRGYSRTTDVTFTDLSWAWAAGGVVSSARDLDAFITALVHGDLVKSRTLEDMTRARSDLGDAEYGLGLFIPRMECGTALGHPGNMRGYTTGVWEREERDRSVVVVINDAAGGYAAFDIAQAALCQ